MRFAQLHEIRANVDKSLDTLYLSHLNRVCKCTTVLLSAINDMMLNKSLDGGDKKRRPATVSDKYVGNDMGGRDTPVQIQKLKAPRTSAVEEPNRSQCRSQQHRSRESRNAIYTQ